MSDRLVHDRADEVVGPEEEGNLRKLRSDLDPVRLDMREVVEQQPRCRDHPQIELPRCLGKVSEGRVRRVERQRDEPREAAGLVLEGAQAQQVVHAVFGGLDGAVEDRSVRSDTEEVALPRDLEPALARDLVLADHVADPLLENLGAAARAGVHAGVLQLADGVGDRAVSDSRDPVELDHRPRLAVHAGEPLLQSAEKPGVVLEGPGRVEASDDVKLRDRFGVSLARLFDALSDRHLVPAGLIDLLRPGAERAIDPAEVRRVQVPVDVVIREVAVTLFADEVGEPARPEEVARREDPDSVVERQPLAGENLLGDGREIGAAEGGERNLAELVHGIAGFVTGWNGVCDSGKT